MRTGHDRNGKKFDDHDYKKAAEICWACGKKRRLGDTVAGREDQRDRAKWKRETATLRDRRLTTGCSALGDLRQVCDREGSGVSKPNSVHDKALEEVPSRLPI